MTDIFGKGLSGARERRPEHEAPILFVVLVGYCVLLIAITAAAPIVGITAHVSNDFGEGWNAYWAQAVQKGLPLYSSTRVFTANNYPPLSFYANAWLGSAIGDNIVAGRIIALASLIGVAGLIARIVHVMGAPPRWSLLSAAIFLLYNLVYLRQMVAVDNPQWLGEMIGLACVLPLTGRAPSALRPRDVVLAAALMVLAGLVKHNQFALPLAITAWLALCNRRAFGVWCVSGLGFVAIACLILYGLYGSAIFVEILGYKRTASLPTFEIGVAKFGAFTALLGVALLSLRGWHGDRRGWLLLLYAAMGIVFALLQRLGSGVYINAYDDAVIALVAVCGAFLGRAAADRDARAPGIWARSALLLVVLAPIILVTPKHVRQSIVDMRDLPVQKTIWAAMIADVRAAPDPVFCELLSVCYWAGKPPGIDFFAYGQKLRTGTDPRPLERAIATRSAALLVIDRNKNVPASEKRLPPPLPDLIDAHYRVTRMASNSVAIMRPLAP